MRPPRDANEYREAILKYGDRSYTKTIFHGFIYRFLVELLKHDETGMENKFPDLNDYILGQLSTFQAGEEFGQHKLSTYTYSQLQDLLDNASPRQGVGQVLFLGGHMPGSWIAGVGAKFGIALEYFRRHIHMWRSSQGAVLYAVPTLPSVEAKAGIALRINTCGDSIRSFGNMSLASRRNVLPEKFYQNPAILTPAPGSTYIRGHAILDDTQFLIEQDISITVESNGDGWTAILWSDVGPRDLSQSHDLFSFLSHLRACSKSGLRWIRLSPTAFLSMDAELAHPLPTLAHGRVPANTLDDGGLVQCASHLPHEFHLILDYDVAALDPLYALSPVLKFSAHTSKSFLGNIMRRYEIISSTLWDQHLSQSLMQELRLKKHLLDDNALRHEQVLRFLRTPRLLAYGAKLTPAQKTVADEAKTDVYNDFEYLLRRCREYSEHHQTAINVLVNATALEESSKQIRLATQVTKLTVLATIFLPLSFCTSIFGMNFVELNGLSVWVWAVVTVCIGLVTLVVYMWDELRRMWERSREKRRAEDGMMA